MKVQFKEPLKIIGKEPQGGGKTVVEFNQATYCPHCDSTAYIIWDLKSGHCGCKACDQPFWDKRMEGIEDES